MHRRKQLVGTLSLATVAAVIAGCSPGLAANPRFATDSGAGPQGQPETTEAPAGPPPIETPKNELTWRECTSRVFSEAGVPTVPGVTLDCASYDADLDPINGAAGTVSIGVVR
ncbi:alpha/beta hydrolase, partial [Mycolicibacterium elephantis]